ncbi:hypothetical protein DBR42_00845 [Pelomonas sp. HMWF004]|nr:hypothetical protein DBR42_00845 [Pelomonas sp. HMWF004]
MVIELPNDGQYVYRNKADHAGTPDSRVFMLGRPARQDFKYLSQAEQTALWNYRQEHYVAQANAAKREAEARAAQAAATAARARMVEARFTSSAATSNARINWPRVVVMGNKICVPQLAYSEASDWRDHLTCSVEPEGSGHVQQ